MSGLPSPVEVDRWLAARAARVPAGVAQRARLIARLSGGGVVSGQDLAADLGISRAAVHKHVLALRGLGLQLRSTPGSGYRLSDASDVIAPEVVLTYLSGSPTGLGLPLLYEASTESTNARAREAAQAGSPHGTLVLTDYQHTGKGRLGRVWVAEPGKDLTFSLLLRPAVPPERASRFTLAASTAVADVVATLGDLGNRVSIKWPNDVLVDGRKICGILSEASLDMDQLHWLVVGIGLNVNGSPAHGVSASDLAPGAPAPTSLRGCLRDPVPRVPLLAALLERLEARWAEAAGEGWAAVLARFHELDALLGKPVEIRSGSRVDVPPLHGIARGLSAEGELRVMTEDGTVRTVLSGDVTLRPGLERGPETLGSQP